MSNIPKCLFIILIYIKCWSSTDSLHVSFRENQDAKVEPLNSQIYKREMSQFFDKASYSFNGFEKVASVPVLFPIDLCIMSLVGVKYAASLHMNKNGGRYFAVFKGNNGTYELISDISTPLAIAMDCKGFGTKGYVAIVNNISSTVENAREGSPIFEIAGDLIRAVQYFSAPNMASVYLRVNGNDLLLLQTFVNTKTAPNLHCPYFIWSGTTFNKMGRIPCSNARHLEPFAIDYENYVAVANYADQRGRTATNSEIYKYVQDKKKFQLLQRFKTNGAVDVKYFSVPFDAAKRHHFIVFGNSINSESDTVSPRESKNLEADSIFYVYEKGQFVPYQRLTFYAVKKFLPVQSVDAEKFLLLVACSNQDIKIYNLNDWKFEESQAQFTEGALSKGVANMRIFQELDNSYLVISNELMIDNEINIFLPIFKQDEQANALRQHIIDWAKANIERLLGIDVEKFKLEAEAKLLKPQQSKSSLEVQNIPTSNIQTVVTKSLVYPRLHLSTNYWKALSYANQALDALATPLTPKQPQKRELTQKRDMKQVAYEFERINVNTLIVTDSLTTKRVNGILAVQPEFESITAKKITVTNSYKAPKGEKERLIVETDEPNQVDILNVENLQITGNINEFSWDELINNTLKRSSNMQFLKAPAVIKSIQAEAVIVTNNKVSEQNIGKLISINGGNYVVDQDIQFAAPVTAKNVTINERLNNIHVTHQKFDVLLKRSNRTQIVEGAKRFDNLKVLEPITIAGQLLGNHLKSISPNKAIHDTLTLHGDYTITGDVNIVKFLNTSNVVDANYGTTIKEILEKGLRIDTNLEDVNIKFEEPIEANDSLVSFVNEQDMQQLLKTNLDEIQVVEGEKLFPQTLEIRRGFSEFKTLNGIDMDTLENRLLLKHTNQTIKNHLHIGKVVARGIQATNLKLNNQSISNFLTKTGDQHIKGTLKVANLTAQTINLQNLNTNGKIYNEKLAEIYQQKAKSAPNNEIFHKNRKFHGSIYVRNLIINSTINGKSVDEIERQLIQLDGNIKYVGNYQFNYDMNITNLTFHGIFNGIPAADFGHSWLQQHGAQSFTTPQTLAALKCDRGLILEGKLNGHPIDDFFSNAYWINRNEHIYAATFQSPTQMQGALLSNTVNGMRIPLDMIYRSSLKPQLLQAHNFVASDLLVHGHIYNTSVVNGINLAEFDRYLSGYGFDTLHLDHANFVYSPHFNTLNRHDLKQTLDAVWLANENVDLQHHVEIAEGYFEGLLEFEGPINNMNLKYLKDNYFSLTRPQDISTELILTESTTFDNSFSNEELQLRGPITDSKSNISIDFDEFVSKTVKTAGPHTISGTWSILEAIVQGDLYNVNINNLNLAQDVVRMDAPINECTAKKRINSVTIKKLYATPTSTVNDVAVANWIRDTVFVYENYTIHGITTLDTVNLYNDLRVYGKVNNMTFDEHTLLLREGDQVVNGDVYVRNSFPSEQRMLSVNFENLKTKTVNGIDVAEFFAYQARKSPTMHANSYLIFTQPLVVEEYHIEENFKSDKWKRGTKLQNRAKESLESWSELENAVKLLKNYIEVPKFILDHFEVRQTLPINITEIIPLTLRNKQDYFDIIGVLDREQNKLLTFYRWDTKQQKFILDKELSWLPQEKAQFDILKLAFENADYLTVGKANNGTYYQNIISRESKGFQEVLKLRDLQSGKIEGFEMQGEDCFVVYGENTATVPIYCLSLADEKSFLKIYQKDVLQRENIKQLLALSNNTVAILFDDAVEIWNTNSSLKLEQRLSILHPKQIAAAFRNDVIYLAIVSEIKANTLHHGAVEIYSSQNASIFKHLQTLDCIEPQQVAFSNIKQSDDLLLHILTATNDQPLSIYQYRGVMGFDKIVGASTLPAAESMKIISLKAAQQHLIALIGKQAVTFLEVILKEF